MTIYCWNTSEAERLGREDVAVVMKTPGCVKSLVDANGLDWKGQKFLWLNTETGEMCEYLMDEEGEIRYNEVYDLITKITKTAAPLRITFEEQQ